MVKSVRLMTGFEKCVLVSHLCKPKIHNKAHDSRNLSAARRSLVSVERDTGDGDGRSLSLALSSRPREGERQSMTYAELQRLTAIKIKCHANDFPTTTLTGGEPCFGSSTSNRLDISSCVKHWRRSSSIMVALSGLPLNLGYFCL